MTESRMIDDLESVEMQAALWVVRIDEGNMTPAQEAELREWVRRSPRHLAELRAMGVAWSGVDELIQDELLSSVSNDNRRSRKGFIAGAVAVAACLLVVRITGPLTPAETVQAVHHYASAVGQQKTVTLADGSTVQLNTDSQIDVRYGETERNIRLLRGEAHFDVEKDKQRPFRVYAGGGVVEAVGTEFVVHLQRKSVEVTVTEGRVELAALDYQPTADTASVPNPSATKSLALLDAHQVATFSSSLERVETIAPTELEKRLAWRAGMLAFDGEPLRNVIAEFERYSEDQIVLSDEVIGGLLVSGYFSAGDVDLLLDTLSVSLGVSVQRGRDGIWYLSKAIAAS